MAAEARHREISSVGAFHPPRHRHIGQSCGRCGPIFDWSVPYGDLSISPTIYLSYRGEKCFAQLPKVANGSIKWNERCPVLFVAAVYNRSAIYSSYSRDGQSFSSVRQAVADVLF